MNISSVSINRPVLATVISILLILFGGIGYTFLGVREFPSVDPPVVTKSDADASPILVLMLQSNVRNLMELSDIASNVFKERLQTIPGVSEIRIWGEKKYAIKLLMDPAKLASYQLTPVDIRNALNRENVEVAFEKYRLGSINDIELRETQKKYIDAQYQLLLSQFQAKKAEIELLRISGELVKVLRF